MKPKTAAPRSIQAGRMLAMIFPALAAIVLLAGCAGRQPKVVLDTVGPAPVLSSGAKSADGSLMVFSAGISVPDLSAENSGTTFDYWEFTGYRIFSPEGKLVKYVENNAGTRLLHPQQVDLPAGNYRVVAEAAGCGKVSVPVIIAGNQVTVLHLDGGFWPAESGFNATNTVHLPNGQIVGWRALAENTDAP